MIACFLPIFWELHGLGRAFFCCQEEGKTRFFYVGCDQRAMRGGQHKLTRGTVRSKDERKRFTDVCICCVDRVLQYDGKCAIFKTRTATDKLRCEQKRALCAVSVRGDATQQHVAVLHDRGGNV